MGALQVMVGFSLSATVTVKLHVAVLPLASVTLNEFTVTPMGNTLPLTKPAVCVITCPGQLSVEELLYVTVAPQTPKSLFTEMGALQVMVGFSLSATVTVKLHVAVLPLASVTLNEFTVTPMGNTLPEARPAVWVMTCPGQLSVELLE
jgi:hypothetical protein